MADFLWRLRSCGALKAMPLMIANDNIRQRTSRKDGEFQSSMRNCTLIMWGPTPLHLLSLIDGRIVGIYVFSEKITRIKVLLEFDLESHVRGHRRSRSR